MQNPSQKYVLVQPRGYRESINLIPTCHVRAEERTSGGLLTYVQHEQPLFGLPIRRNLVREVWVHVDCKVPNDRLWWLNKCELPSVAGNREDEKVGRLRGINLGWNAGKDH